MAFMKINIIHMRLYYLLTVLHAYLAKAKPFPLMVIVLKFLLAEVAVMANFPIFSQICLKFGHTANVCHFRSNISYQLHESLYFIDSATQ